MGNLSNKYLNKIIAQKLFDGPGDLPDTLEGLNANDYTAVVYNAVIQIIGDLKKSGELKPDQNLDAAGITAQILLETGNGKSSLASKYNNFGGIKAGKYWKGETIMIPNSDGDVNWRVYPTVKKGLEEQVRFFLPSKNPRYFKAGVLSAKNAAEHAKRVQEAGYAGDQKDYADRVIEMANSIQNRLKKANPDYSKGATYTGVSVDNNTPTTTSYQEATGQDFIQQDFQPITIGKPNPAAVFLNDNTKVDLLNVFTDPVEISNPSTKILDNSFYNDNRNKEQIIQSKKNQNFIDSQIKYKKGGKMKFNKIYSSKYKNYPRYYNPGGPLDNVDLSDIIGEENFLINKPGYGAKKTVKKFDDFIDPISFNVDAETGNKKIYNPKTGKFDVTDTPYEDKGEYGVSMMSHRADMYEDDDMSPEAKAARIQKGKDMLKYSQMKANRAMQQFADRSDYSAEKGLGLREQGVSKGFWDTYKNQYQCISGSSSNCSPIPGMPMDKNQPNYATVPHFNKNRKGELILNTQKTAGTQKSGKGSTGPGDNIPNMGGNETFASWGTRNYGFEMTPPQSPLKEGQILVHHAYDDWKSKAAGVDNPPYKNTFQYGRVKNWGPYHAQTVGNIDKESVNGIEKEGFRIGNNPGHGKYRLDNIKPVGENVYRDVAQFNWVYDNPYYKKVLADIQKKNKLSKND